MTSAGESCIKERISIISAGIFHFKDEIEDDECGWSQE
jgi:hypothetical protein